MSFSELFPACKNIAWDRRTKQKKTLAGFHFLEGFQVLAPDPEYTRDCDFISQVWKFGVNETKIISLWAQMELEKVLELYIDAEKHDKSIGIGFEAFQTLL